MRIAIIAGATGLVGTHLTHLCLENDHFDKTIVITRRPLGIDDFRLTEVVLSDFDKITALQIPKADEYHSFCCLGTTMARAGSQDAFEKVDLDYVLLFARRSIQLNCSHFSVVSSLGANSRSLSFYSRTKGRMEDAVKQLGFPSLSILRPSLLLGERKEKRFMEDLAKPFAKFLPKSFRGIEGFHVAKAMVELSLQKHPGNHTYSSGEILAIAESS